MSTRISILVVQPDSEGRQGLIDKIKEGVSTAQVLEAEDLPSGLQKAARQKFNLIVLGAALAPVEVAAQIKQLQNMGEEFRPGYVFSLLSEEGIGIPEGVPTTAVQYYAWPMHEDIFAADIATLFGSEGVAGFLNAQKTKETKQKLLTLFFEVASRLIQEQLGAELKREDLKIRTPEDLSGDVSVVHDLRVRNLVGSLGIGFQRDFIDGLVQSEDEAASTFEYQRLVLDIIEKIYMEMQNTCLEQSIAFNGFSSSSRVQAGHLIPHFVQSSVMCLKVRTGALKGQIEICFKEFL